MQFINRWKRKEIVMLECELTPEEARVLGCLMEKEMATPEYYPLSLNGLQNACNQKSNRNPVVAYDEETVLQALDGLKENHLTLQSNAARVPKYEQHFGKSLNLVAREMSLICLLLLRGPQTVGELRARAERMYAFESLEETMETLQALEKMELVQQMPRQPGQKEARYVQLLTGEPLGGGDEAIALPTEPGQTLVPRKERIANLEEEVAALREELKLLRQDLLDFKQQFE
jgi:uncharacterized protein YceH (UPF0502 family)